MARSEARTSLRTDKQTSFLKKTTFAVRKLLSNDHKSYWDLTNKLIGRNTKTPPTGPLLSPDGSIINDNDGKIKRWMDHFSSLADNPNKDLNASFYEDAIPDQGNETLHECNRPISWDELNNTLWKCANHKATGDDNIPYEYLKLVTENQLSPDYDTSRPKSPMGRAVLKIVNFLFKSGIVPKSWSKAAASNSSLSPSPN